MEKRNQQLTCGLFAVYKRGEKRSSFLSADRRIDAYTSRVGAAHDGAAGRGEAG